MENLKADIESLSNMKIDNDEMRDNLSYGLAMTAFRLMKERMADFALLIMERVRALNPDDAALKQFYQNVKEVQNLIEPFDKFKDDENVPEKIKKLIERKLSRYTGFNDFKTEEDFEEEIIEDAREYIESIGYIRKNHPEIFKQKKTFFNKLLNNPTSLPIDINKYSGYKQDENVSTTFVSVDKVGRNDPCPCGSGKKYKKCCGK